MLEVYELMGTMVVSTDKPVTELKRSWMKGLYDEFEIGKPLNPNQYFQILILLGEFLAEELYSLKDNPLVNKNLRETYLKISNSLGHYMDRFLFYALQCHEKGEKVEVPHGSISLLEDACSRAMEFTPIPEKVMDKFCNVYGVNMCEVAL
ncbi:hypothetical protein ACJDU8_18950 [Clostridium sp. WILCCON 0269]|uniref:Uncharacterized protein n=1 Tax=Candidatus Clostridium eludens TaxID=3381663 RepID=A0ABW8SPL4_9CLOT